MNIFEKLEQYSLKSSEINKDLYDQYNVKRGLRNKDGSGVLVGLTHIGDVVGYNREGDKVIPCHGELYYRGYSVADLVKGFQSEKRHGFDETVFLLVAGKLPTREELEEFTNELSQLRDLPHYFTKNMLLSLRGRDVMNMLARSVLMLYEMDEDAENYSHINLTKQCLNLIAKFPVITCYAYYSYRHLHQRRSLIIRHPDYSLSTAENFLYMLKGENYTQLEAEILDLALVLHAEHGGGNNSSFTTRVVSSAQTDTYSAIAAALGSLKGRLHGGANLKVIEMMENIKANVSNWEDEEEISEYILKILNKEAFDQSGKVYGLGHAIYTLSDPRAILLKEKARELAKEKGKIEEFNLYNSIEKLTPLVFSKYKGGDAKTISANVDFYSGFVYLCLDIPKEIFTPIFAIARIGGWCSHRLEEVSSSARRIIRPAYKNVCTRPKYVPIKEREESLNYN